MTHYKRILTIAGSDSGAGAGIQADLKTIMATGGYATTVITAITAQNTQGVTSIHLVPLQEIQNQLNAVTEDIGYDAVKTGMIPTEEAGELIATHLKKYPTKNLVVDPVLSSSSGIELAHQKMIAIYQQQLLPLTTVFTPNLTEATAFLGGYKITTLKEQKNACKRLAAFGCLAVLLKGGHGDSDILTDVLYMKNDDVFITYSHSRIETKNSHGTGCTLASAIASYLALGSPIPEACEKAITYVQEALTAGAKYELGKGTGPLKH